jgi:hypothetical protein
LGKRSTIPEISVAPKATNQFVSSVLLLLLGLNATSFACIGETMDEAIMRYGEAVQHEIVGGKEYYLFNQNGFNILAHFNEGKIDVIGYGKESGERLTSEEINTFLKVNNGDQPMNKQGPNAWVGNNVIAMYKQEGGAWHLSIIVHKQKIKRNRET